MEDIYDDEKDLRIKTTTQKVSDFDILLFEVVGSIDTHTCSIHLLDNIISQKVQESGLKHIVFDMGGLNHINSTGIGFFIKLADQLKKDKEGAIYIVNLDADKQHLFDMLGLWGLFIKVEANQDIANYLEAS